MQADTESAARCVLRGSLSQVGRRRTRALPKWDRANWDRAKWDRANWDRANWDRANWDRANWDRAKWGKMSLWQARAA